MSIFEIIFRGIAVFTLTAPPSSNGALAVDESEGGMRSLLLERLTRWMLDYTVRIVLLFSVGLGLEYLIGNDSYESYYIDYMLVLIAGLGGVHWVCLFVILSSSRPSRSQFLVYRVVRNSCLAPIVGLFVLPPILIWEAMQGLVPYESGVAVLAYQVGTGAFLITGLLEAFIRKRIPTAISAGKF